MKEIPLSQGKVALVDDLHFDWLMQWRWHAVECRGLWYAVRNSKRKDHKPVEGSWRIYMHRAILCPVNGYHVDHINHDGFDNRVINLRLVTHAENQHNQRANRNRGYTSQFKGVHFCKSVNKWIAAINVGGVRQHIGNYRKEVDAAKAYNRSAVKYFGEFASLNQFHGEPQ